MTPRDCAWQTAPGAQVPLDTMLRDEAGHAVRLRQLFAGKPVILDLGYYHCPSLCGVVRADLFNALADSGLVGGQDYTLVALSIDPAETPRDAAEAKAADLARTPAATGGDWHYLTGSAAAIAAVEVGGRLPRALRSARCGSSCIRPALSCSPRTASSAAICSGVGYSGGRPARGRRSQRGDGGIARAVLPVLLLCFHYDPATGRYTLAIEKVLRLMALLTVRDVGRHDVRAAPARPESLRWACCRSHPPSRREVDWLIGVSPAFRCWCSRLVLGLMLVFVIRYRETSPLESRRRRAKKAGGSRSPGPPPPWSRSSVCSSGAPICSRGSGGRMPIH